MVDRQAVFQMMEHFGICRDDKVTVHSSLRAVGPIENGAEGLLDAMREYLCNGLLLIPTHTWRDFYLRPYYDPRETETCLGVLSRIAAFHPDGVRSLHPTHSVAVFGKGAAEYVSKEKTFTSPQPADHCVSRLREEKGKILLLGVGLESCTYIHGVEEWLKIPNRLTKEGFPVAVKNPDGSFLHAQLHAYRAEGLDRGVSDFYPNLEKPLAYLGALTYGQLGQAQVMCCDAAKTSDALKLLWSKAEFDLCFGEREIPEAYYR